MFGQLARSFWPETLPAISSQPSSAAVDLIEEKRAGINRQGPKPWSSWQRYGMFPKQTLGPKGSSARKGAKLFYYQPVEGYADRESGLIGVVSIDADETLITPAHVRSKVFSCRYVPGETSS